MKSTGRRLIAAMGLVLAVLAGCAPQMDRYRGRLLHVNDRFTPEELSDQELVVFPLIRNSRFDTTAAFSPFVLAQRLRKTRPDLGVYFKEEFERRLLDVYPRDSLDIFYDRLFKNDIIALQTSDSAWASMPGRYALVLRIRDAGRVKDFKGITRRKLYMEAELWDASTAEVVWRAEVSGFDPDASTSDAEFVLSGIEEAYALLPPYKPALHEQEW
ncbi:MAG: hypothetical protein GF418_05440 [Chitinivibrionales bacterium]|nr:hypothetical protein [Chitinivibrionales bacterium]MBD3395055.1 hypothetical protein [Chitinivibrionales bacterium]